MNAGGKMNTMIIRGIDDELKRKIKQRSKEKGLSINKILINIIKKSFNLEKQASFPEYHDLDHLAGKWSKKDHRDFNKYIEDFEKIDRELWKK